MENTLGKIHSIENCGTIDGPGIRFVVSMQGCNMTCTYCQNPDTWDPSVGTTYTAKDLFIEAQKYESYMHFSNGGVTVTGGEPLLQPEFLIEFFMLCKTHDIHTALVTSGSILNDQIKILLEWTDLIILDIKSYDKEAYHLITGGEQDKVFAFLDYVNMIQKRIWIRFVYVPHLTDNLVSISELSKYLSKIKGVERIEILPFRKINEHIWKDLGKDYALFDTPTPTESELLKVLEVFYRDHRSVFIV